MDNKIDRDPNHLYPAFRAKMDAVLQEMNRWCTVHLAGAQAAVVEGFRTADRQKQLFAQGRDKKGAIIDRRAVVTYKNGTTNPSNHQTCLAADVAFIEDGHFTWDAPDAAWAYLRHLAHTHCLTSGQDWRTFKDKPHVEWPTSDSSTYEEAARWKRQQGLV